MTVDNRTSDESNSAIDWTDPAADVRDQLVERWFRRHPTQL